MIRWQRPATSHAERMRRRRFAAWMDVYWTARHAWWLAMEAETALGREEIDRYVTANGPGPTFKAYLIATAGQPR